MPLYTRLIEGKRVLPWRNRVGKRSTQGFGQSTLQHKDLKESETATRKQRRLPPGQPLVYLLAARSHFRSSVYLLSASTCYSANSIFSGTLGMLTHKGNNWPTKKPPFPGASSAMLTPWQNEEQAPVPSPKLELWAQEASRILLPALCSTLACWLFSSSLCSPQSWSALHSEPSSVLALPAQTCPL